MSLVLGALVEALSGEFQATLSGDPQRHIARLAPIEAAGPADLSFVSHPKYSSKLAASQAGCIIVSPALQKAAALRGDRVRTGREHLGQHRHIEPGASEL